MNPRFDVLMKSYSQLRSDLRSARGMRSLVAGLREFFREPVTFENVYLTSDEFKGKKEVIRGGQSFRVTPKDLELQES